jgi:peptidoglycan/xylan/chitin deacetylase (PgdA/CDA1 family)
MRSPKHWLKDIVYNTCWLMTGRRHSGVRVILLYHSVGNSVPLSVPTRDFRRQVAYLKKHFRIVLLRDLPRVLAEAREEEAIACVTFDDGLLDNYEHALPILEDHSIKASFFIPTGSIGGMHSAFYGEQPCMTEIHLREVASLGHELGAHTVTHPKLTRVSLAEAHTEIAESKARLEDLLNEPVTSFAYPKGDYNEEVKQLTGKAGFQHAVTTREALVDNTEIDWLRLPRVWINPTMGWMQFQAKLSSALELYEHLIGRMKYIS